MEWRSKRIVEKERWGRRRTRGGWGEGTRRNGTERHPQFRDCFSDDTLYTHGQHQPTHYGNDTCASIRINILMDVREGEEREWFGARESGEAQTLRDIVVGECERGPWWGQWSVVGVKDEVAWESARLEWGDGRGGEGKKPWKGGRRDEGRRYAILRIMPIN